VVKPGLAGLRFAPAPYTNKHKRIVHAQLRTPVHLFVRELGPVIAA